MRTGVLLLMHGVEPGVWSRQLAPGPQLVGRSHHCHIQIPAPGVSRKHALIEVRPSSMLIGDLGSRNGTFVNDRPVPRDPVTPFTLGDVIRLGPVVLDVVSGTTDRPAAVYEVDEDSTPSMLWRGASEPTHEIEELTPRDKEVLTLLLQGYSEKRAAGFLGVERSTVHSHVEHIYVVYGVHSRPELLALVLGNNHGRNGPA